MLLVGLRILEEQDFFKAAILLIWIEADRQIDLPEQDKRYDYVQKIIDKINRIPDKPEPVDWGKFFSIEFVCWWVGYIDSVWPFERLKQIDLVIKRTHDNTLYNLFEIYAKKDFLFFNKIFVPFIEKTEDPLLKSKLLSLIASELAKNEELEEAKEVLKSSIKISKNIQEKIYKDDAFLKIATAIFKSGNLESIIPIIENIESDLYKNIALVNIAKEFFVSGNREKGDNILVSTINISNNIESVEDKSWIWLSISKVLISIGEIDKSLELLDFTLDLDYHSSGIIVKDDIFSEVAIIYANIGEYQFAIDTADKIEWDGDRLITYSKIITALTESGDTDKAKELFESVIISNTNNL